MSDSAHHNHPVTSPRTSTTPSDSNLRRSRLNTKFEPNFSLPNTASVVQIPIQKLQPA